MGEIRVAAETIDTQGVRRKITLDPLNKKDLSIEVREVESTIPCGLQAHWGQGRYGNLEFDLNAGAGFGSRWLTMTIKGRSEGEHDYCINADDIAKAVLAYHEELYPPRKRKKGKTV